MVTSALGLRDVISFLYIIRLSLSYTPALSRNVFRFCIFLFVFVRIFFLSFNSYLSLCDFFYFNIFFCYIVYYFFFIFF